MKISLTLFILITMLSSCTHQSVKFNSVPPQKTQVQREIKRDFIGIEDSLKIAQLKLKQFSKHHNSGSKYIIISLNDLVWSENSEIWSIRPEFQSFIKQVIRNKYLKLVILKDHSKKESRLIVKNLFLEFGISSNDVEFLSERELSKSSEITSLGMLMFLGSQRNAIASFESLIDSPLLVYQLKSIHILLPELHASLTQTAKND